MIPSASITWTVSYHDHGRNHRFELRACGQPVVRSRCGADPIAPGQSRRCVHRSAEQRQYTQLRHVERRLPSSQRRLSVCRAFCIHATFRQTVANGDNSDLRRLCATINALCQGDGVTPITDATGANIPDLTNGGANIIGQNDFERLNSDGLGGSLQLTSYYSHCRTRQRVRSQG